MWKAKLSDVAASYNSSDTNNDHFTFGASGFDVYLKYNDIELVRLKEYRHMDAGLVSLQANNNCGFRDVNVHYLQPKSLLSNTEAGVIDLRDFGLRDITTTGSIDGRRQRPDNSRKSRFPGW